jgi:AcrR family transcriptional regulator
MIQEQHDIKTRILLAAKKLFAKQGFEGTSVRQICEEAGGNVALVSYHFGGKENVYRAIFDEFFPGNKLDQYEEVLQDPVQGIEVLVTGILTFFNQDEELATIIQQDLSMQSPRTKLIQSYISPVWIKLKEILERGREQGVFHFDSLDMTWMMTMGTIIFPNQYQSHCLDPIIRMETDNIQAKIEATVSYILGALKYQGK